MPIASYCPPGYLTKTDAAQRLGMCLKTLERRMKTEPVLSQVLRKGRQVFFSERAVEAYYKLAQQRGYL
ncbi:MAG: hypothetical protein DHS20C14_01540 [Phycisphaeraceae bacterium]|nr:MAG: hypothetical protein DHS20C14_01540 [Phycisphaeraceae bacterium]